MAHGACNNCGNAVEECECEGSVMTFSKLADLQIIMGRNWKHAPGGALIARDIVLWNMQPQSIHKSELNLPVGTLVTALRKIDPEGANVRKGDRGMVIEPRRTDQGVTYGPLVQWLRIYDGGIVYGGVCNVYPGDVRAQARGRDAEILMSFITERH